mgnify:CR=1 FL=1|jgi:lia operon protein LiaG
MKKNLYISLSILGILIVVYFFIALIFSNFDLKMVFGKDERTLDSIDYEVNVSELNINVSSDNIVLKKSDDNNVHIKYYKSNKKTFETSFNDGLLTINQTKPWYVMFSFSRNYSIEISLPNTELNSVSIKVSSGNINIDMDIMISNLSIRTSSGNISLEGNTTNNTNINVSSGKINLKDFKSNELDIKASSGKINANNIEVGKVKFNISSGNINLEGGTINFLEIDTSSGNVKSTKLSLGSANIDTSSGDVNLGIKVLYTSIYKMDLETSSGDILITGGGYNISTKGYLVTGDGNQLIKVDVSSGDIKINFEN